MARRSSKKRPKIGSGVFRTPERGSVAYVETVTDDDSASASEHDDYEHVDEGRMRRASVSGKRPMKAPRPPTPPQVDGAPDSTPEGADDLPSSRHPHPGSTSQPPGLRYRSTTTHEQQRPHRRSTENDHDHHHNPIDINTHQFPSTSQQQPYSRPNPNPTTSRPKPKITKPQTQSIPTPVLKRDRVTNRRDWDRKASAGAAGSWFEHDLYSDIPLELRPSAILASWYRSRVILPGDKDFPTRRGGMIPGGGGAQMEIMSSAVSVSSGGGGGGDHTLTTTTSGDPSGTGTGSGKRGRRAGAAAGDLGPPPPIVAVRPAGHYRPTTRANFTHALALAPFVMKKLMTLLWDVAPWNALGYVSHQLANAFCELTLPLLLILFYETDLIYVFFFGISACVADDCVCEFVGLRSRIVGIETD